MRHTHSDNLAHYFSFGGTDFIFPLENVSKIDKLFGNDVIGSYSSAITGVTNSSVLAKSLYGKMMLEAVKKLISK